MRIWSAPPKTLAPIFSDPFAAFRLQPERARHDLPIFTVVAMQMSPRRHPIHTALAVFTSELEAFRMMRQIPRPTPPAIVRAQEAA